MPAAKLWLFDIDGTLVDTGGAGMRALQEAAVECFGGEGPPLDLAGSTDLGVLVCERALAETSLAPSRAVARRDVTLIGK